MTDIIQISKELFSQKITPRETYYKKLHNLLDSNQIVVVQGQRRVGKSYVIIGYLQQLKINVNSVFFLSKELDIRNEVPNNISLANIFDSYVKEHGEPEFIIIDEIQDIKDRERFVRAKYAFKRYKIIISGSNSHLLGGELATYLAGRYLTLEVFPLGYDEYCLFTKKPNIIDTYMEYQQWGGLPESSIMKSVENKKNYLEGVLNTIFIKDIIARYNIKDVGYLQKVLHYISDIIGSEMSIRNIYNSFKEFGRGEEGSLVKLSNYLNMLQTPYLIHKVQRFDIAGKKILEHNEKYYFNDIGLRNSIKNRTDIDKAKILENVVFLHLKRCGYKVYIGNYNNKEIDFVAQKRDRIIYIQVARIIDNDKTRQREYGNLLSINDGFPKYVVTTDLGEPSHTNGIMHLNIMQFINQISE